MDLFEALYTTRAMRRVTTAPIPDEVQADLLDAAIRAPSGGNAQGWRFLLVDDPELRGQLAVHYRESMEMLWDTEYKARIDAARAAPDDPRSKEFDAVMRSAQWLADHFEDVPLLLFALDRTDRTGGSIFPAVWSAMLAARAHGVGSCLTVVLSLFRHDEVCALLGVPLEHGWRLRATVTLGYPTGRWAIAPRRPASEVAHRNRFGAPIGLQLDAPRWPAGVSPAGA